MKKIALSGLLGFMLVLGCGREKPSEPEITEPITITSPTQNAIVSDTVTIRTMVGTNYSFSRVDFLVDSDSVYSDQTAPFTCNWYTGIYRDSSHHVLQAIAYNDTSYESDTVGVKVIIPGGPVSIISPEDGSTVTGSASIIARKATAYDFQRLVLFVNSDSVKFDTSTSYTVIFTLDVSGYQDNSSLSLSVKGVDEDSLEYISSPVNVFVILNPIIDEFEYISTFSISAPAARVSSEGGYLYVAAGSEGMYGIDVSYPQSPDWLFTYDSPGQAMGIDVDLPYILLADGDPGVKRFNNTNPDTIIPAGYYDTPGLSRNVKVSENILLVADNDALEIISIDGNTLNHCFRLPITAGLVIDVDAIGETAYVLDLNGITVVDFSTPTSPDILSRYEFATLTGQGQSVCAVDSFVFVGTTAELVKLSSANHSQLRSLYRLDNEAGFTGVFATNMALYASLGGSNGGAFAFEYRSADSLAFLDQYINSDNCHDICATGPFVFLAGQTKVDILRFAR